MPVTMLLGEFKAIVVRVCVITGGVAVTTQVPSVSDLTTQANANGLYFSDLFTEGVVGFIYCLSG